MKTFRYAQLLTSTKKVDRVFVKNFNNETDVEEEERQKFRKLDFNEFSHAAKLCLENSIKATAARTNTYIFSRLL